MDQICCVTFNRYNSLLKGLKRISVWQRLNLRLSSPYNKLRPHLKIISIKKFQQKLYYTFTCAANLKADAALRESRSRGTTRLCEYIEEFTFGLWPHIWPSIGPFHFLERMKNNECPPLLSSHAIMADRVHSQWSDLQHPIEAWRGVGWSRNRIQYSSIDKSTVDGNWRLA